MLLKMIGLITIVFACGAFGFSMSYEYQSRIKQLISINKLLMLLEGEIKYSNSGIIEAISKVKQQTAGVYSTFLDTVNDCFKLGDKTLSEAWNKGIYDVLRKELNLNKEDLLILNDLGLNLGITDRQTQILNLERTMDIIGRTVAELNGQKMEKCRMYRMMGVTVGVFTAIILV